MVRIHTSKVGVDNIDASELIKKESERIESSEIMGTLLEKSRETHMYISIN